MGGDKIHYPKDVWAPTGGWYCDPKHWKRNTALAFIGAFAIMVPIFLHSAKLEERPLYPVRFIPSQLWCKNFPPPPEGKSS